jgi:DNA-binding MarR family transcriptional regulator
MKKEIIPPNNEIQNKIFLKIQSEMKEFDLLLLNCIAEIISLSSIVSASFDKHFSRYNLSQPGFLTIMMIYSDSETQWTTIRLADALRVKPPTMTGILDTLEKNNMINRIPSNQDRRVINVNLSKNGIKTVKKILPDHISRVISAFSSFDQSLRYKQAKLFPVILDSLEKLNQKEIKDKIQ